MTTREAAIALICLILGGTIGAAILCCCVAAGREDRRMEPPRPRKDTVMACKNCIYYDPSETRRWHGFCIMDGGEVKAYDYYGHGCGERRWPKR